MRACVHFGVNLKYYGNMSEQDSESGPMRTSEASYRNSTTYLEAADEAASLAANNSIIGKVKSRVSSIFPNRLSKWFSPSSGKNTSNNDSSNGNLRVGEVNRRRRRLEIDEDDEDDEEDVDDEDVEEDDGDEEHELGEYDENLLVNQQDDEENSDDESNNSEEAADAMTMASGYKIAPPRDVLRHETAGRQPPSKRSRFNLEVTTPPTTSSIRDSYLMQRHPIVSSTPTTGVSDLRTTFKISSGSAASRTSHRYPRYKLYGNQGRKPEAFNFKSSPIANDAITPNVLGSSCALANSATVSVGLEPAQANRSNLQTDMCSRRSLNIPRATLTSMEHYSGLSNLKRQALSNLKNDCSRTSSLPRRTSTRIFENEASEHVEHQHKASSFLSNCNAANEHETQQSKDFNGRVTDDVGFKRQKLINGADDALDNTSKTISKEEGSKKRDSVSESSDGAAENVVRTTEASHTVAGSSDKTYPKVAGLFNFSAANNSRNGSRTSSFGNGLNFYTHLEGRKSLFAEVQSVATGQQKLNNSTLSLTSLNRRQFNASIYGSTSALSDSRLLNTFSPFYKGKTTYGGASAYNKYATLGTGAGASSGVRIAPTLIRPTSSLSTLSSSNNSLTATAIGGNAAAECSSALSSTAKRILDLINDFATPLSDAKKMASNLKASQQQQQPQLAKGRRFNDADLNTSRAVRLSQVRSPYMRPSVTLHPTIKTNSLKPNSSLPPVRELQVPSMSQLLQMKKMQSTTERSRQIATENSRKITTQQPLVATSISEYKLPVELHSDTQRQQQHQKHTNKIKNKITSSVRAPSSKNSIDDAPLIPADLPNIAFPIMQSSPKFDISLPNSSVPKSSVPPSSAVGGGDAKSYFGSNKAMSTFVFKPSDTANKTQTDLTITSPVKTNFKFSAPLPLEGVSPLNITPINGNYKFSAPMWIQKDCCSHTVDVCKTSSQIQLPPPPELKAGSVLEALKKPFALPTIKTPCTVDNSLATQFKKSTNEWECETCMIRNNNEVNKCVACETPRKVQKNELVSLKISESMPVSSFGNQFKKSVTEWECETCMVRNKQDVKKCVACETPLKCGSPKSSEFVPSQMSGPSFGDNFKPKANSWECPTCLINNKNESFECVACQTKKPGRGEDSSSSGAVLPVLSSDAGFLSLAASQKASKWECVACMTRNDISRLKCVCCEEAKPGSQAVSENVAKFSFGSTAAAKFSFGFGANSNAPKEEELRKKENLSKTDTKTTTDSTPLTGFVFGTSVPATDNQNSEFTFGIKHRCDNEKFGKDVGDSTKPSTNMAVSTKFKLEGSTSSKVSTSTTSATTTIANLLGVTDTAITTTPTPNFSLPTAQPPTADTSKLEPKFAFGSSSSISTSTIKIPVPQPTSGFTFGLSKPAENPVIDIAGNSGKQSSAIGGFTFAAPTKTTETTNNLIFVAPASTSASTTATAPTAAIKPLFSFCPTAQKSSSTAAPPLTTVSSNAAQNSDGFSFSNISSASSISAEAKPLFRGAVAPPATTAVSSSSAPKNVFGSSGATATTKAVFGAVIPNTTNASSTPADFNTTSTFGSMSSAVTSSPQFGIFGNSEHGGKPKSTSLFGSSNSIAPSGNTPFAFGSTTANNSNVTTTTSSTAWPKNSFVFGSPASASSTPIMSNETSKQPQPSFGTFGTSSTSNVTVNSPVSSSIFGNVAGTSKTATFGSATSATPIFSSNSVPAVALTGSVNNNLFGSTASSNATSTFGVSQFGNNNPTALAQTFGSAASTGGSAPTPGTFGGFGSISAATNAGNASDGASAAKKSDTTFTFGAAAPAVSQISSGGFNFGSTAAISKPAFNFGATSAASTGNFNFTGSTETTKPTTQPFQFGATPLAPVFNFSGGAMETPANAPFQFNAGAAPIAASNIFAPTPGAQSAQQARRKIRAPTRRLTPR